MIHGFWRSDWEQSQASFSTTAPLCNQLDFGCLLSDLLPGLEAVCKAVALSFYSHSLI